MSFTKTVKMPRKPILMGIIASIASVSSFADSPVVNKSTAADEKAIAEITAVTPKHSAIKKNAAVEKVDVSVKKQAQLIGKTEEITRVIDPSSPRRDKTIKHPGATFIKLHISEINLANGDFITISDSQGNETFRYPSGTNTSAPVDGFWAISVLGDTAVVRLRGPSGKTKDADHSDLVVIDQYSYGLSQKALQENQFVTKSICGAEDHVNVACYSNSNPTEYANSTATARVIYQEGGSTYTCTGWRVGPNPDTLITNEHCLSNQAITDTAEIWFNYQYNNCEGSGSPYSGRVVVTADRLLAVSEYHDMALVTLNNADTIAQFGAYELDNRAPVLGENIYIPQHPGGIPKRLSIFSDQNNGLCEIDSTNDFGGRDIGYYCDTEGGSSGSPVIASSTNKVIGLHHYGGCTNNGVRVDQFYSLVAPYLDDQPSDGGGNNGGGNDGGGSNGGGNGSTNILAATSFEGASTGDWSQGADDDFDFTLTSGTTPSSSTGPSGAVDGNYYAYLETSDGRGAFYAGETATLETTNLFTADNLNLSFSYHMRGRNIGTLEVQVRESYGAWQTVWSESGGQGDRWFSESVDLSAYRDEVQVRFLATADGGWRGDIALDEVVLSTTDSDPSVGDGDPGGANDDPGNTDPGDGNSGSGNGSGGNGGSGAGNTPYAFGIEQDGTVYHLQTNHTADWVYLCLNDDCRAPSDTSNGRWSHNFSVDPSQTYNITVKIQDAQAPGQCITTETGVAVGSGVARSGCSN
ncbi:trypsin-like peptidase domain-containing protein [Marinibactrum halimedae]|uniref:Serine protease n=1 Tax=Marinibactrum halimedae TaxID=1444977 RepID=A0AA37WMW3_9GAMM|nr:trypsin-like peptidase domain-containing protein [Marinibactrum halimedae]MCD9459587.1 trypsin-like peptidase domain-containing protein [Marinibactrum halimedae]GLS25596.1 hypothetical protein GCM10007877_13100 [Marinibactrum halimedae]